ncbi:MAG: hypothetical protein ACXVCE_17715, partial [Bacteriovorax sp.]
FTLNPSVFFIESRWPLDELWEQKKSEAEDLEDELFLKESPEKRAFLMFRRHQDVHLISLSTEQNIVLSFIRDGKSLEEIYEILNVDDALQISAYFSEWFNLNLFSSFYL